MFLLSGLSTEFRLELMSLSKIFYGFTCGKEFNYFTPLVVKNSLHRKESRDIGIQNTGDSN